MITKLFSTLSILLLVGITSCSQAQNTHKSNDENSSTVKKQAATIDHKGDYYFLIFDNEPNSRYLDTNIEPTFRQDKMRVIVSGEKLPIPPNVRMAGNPFKITSIEIDGGVQIDNKLAVENTISDEGTVKLKGDVFVIETTETIYVPKKLAADFQKEGAAVAFTANKLPIPPNVRMIGQPIEIVTIKSNVKSMQLEKTIDTKVKTKIK
ncbi:MAG: hypothetical protein R3E32_19630 [Chitinophagales bacterium]